MKRFFKTLTLFCLFFLFGGFLRAQATLPTFFSFETFSPPTGWTLFLDVSAGDTYYSGGSDDSPSCRLDATGEYVQIYFSDAPDSVSYHLRSTGIGSQHTAAGTLFSVQHSANGVNWTDLRVLDASSLSGSFTPHVDYPPRSARYVRFYYTQKRSGSNIALDEIKITKAAPGPEASLILFQNGNRIAAGSTLVVPNTLAIDIGNEGTSDVLLLTGSTITGPNASDFQITGLPSSVNPGDSEPFTLQFTPGGTGSRFATLTLQSNDPYNPSFSVPLYGISGGLATQPAGQPSNLQFSNLQSYTFNVSYTAPSNVPERYLILRKSSPITEAPVNGSTYRQGDYIGAAQITYLGTATSFKPEHIIANTPYYFKVFSCNGPAGYEHYLLSNPASGTTTTYGRQTGSYYSGITSSSPSLISQLHSRINPHTQIPYGSYASTLIDHFEERDTTDGQKAVICSYSGYAYLYRQPFVWDTLSREHVFAHSWFASYPATNYIEYSDLYNLFPVQLTRANIPRSNRPFGEVVTVTQTFHDGKAGYDANGIAVYEPRDEIKGNVARAIFYMLTCYHTANGLNWTLPTTQDQQVLKNWHFQDPPDNYEIARNEYIYSLQNNRNPFIDSIHFACYIDFSNMSYISNPPGWCVALSNTDIPPPDGSGWIIFPNPSSDEATLRFSEPMHNSSDLYLTDLSGRLLQHRQIAAGTQEARISLHSLPAGAYRVEIRHDRHASSRLLIKH